MELCLDKVPEDKWEMERSPLIGQNSAANTELLYPHNVCAYTAWT